MAEINQSQDEQSEVLGGHPRVFVYGTLKRGKSNHPLLVAGGARYLGEESLVGAYRLVDLGYYPGLVRDADSDGVTVHGEVYEVDGELLATLDILEGHPSYYRRSKLNTGKFKNVWVYFLPPGYREAGATIESGVWEGRGNG